MPRDDTLRSIYRRFRRGGELRPLVCLAATIASGLLLGGLGVLGGWTRGMLRVDPSGRGVAGRVRDDDIGAGALIAGIAWLVLLVWVWRPAVRLRRHSLAAEHQRRWTTPLLATAAITGAVTVLSYVVGIQRWDDVEWAVTGLLLIGGGVALIVWLPVVFGLEQVRPSDGPAGGVKVHCPACGYSMVGLREATCPECGRSYTVDELIRGQGYVETPPAVRDERETDGSAPER